MSSYNHRFYKALTTNRMRKKLIAGNWKMNGSLAFNAELLASLVLGASEVGGATIAVCVPFPYLAQAGAILVGTSIGLGAQDVSEYPKGAYTGEVSASMLSDFGCTYVLVGHSERRSLFGDTDQRVAEKFATALSAGLCPILCVGETLEEREAGVTGDVVARQLDAVLSKVQVSGFQHAVVAYEPVWAIGTGRTASPEQAQEVHAFIRGRVAAHDRSIANDLRILYGGSMKPANAAELLAQPDIDGGLIGGASLVAQEFLAIAVSA